MDRPITVGIHNLCEHSTAPLILASAFRRESPGYFREWSTNDVIERL
jgi:hypothetical protein